MGRTFQPKAIWLFGSLAWGEPHLHSDVDVLVEGLGPSNALLACNVFEEKVAARVDFIRLEDASQKLVTRVRQSGTLLYES